MADIVFINPRFEVSFWGLEHALPLFGKKANMAVGCLPLLAALTPTEHNVTLLDECVERDDPVLRRAPVEDPGAPDVPRREVAERALALVLVLDPQPTAWCCGERGTAAMAGLD